MSSPRRQASLEPLSTTWPTPSAPQSPRLPPSEVCPPLRGLLRVAPHGSGGPQQAAVLGRQAHDRERDLRVECRPTRTTADLHATPVGLALRNWAEVPGVNTQIKTIVVRQAEVTGCFRRLSILANRSTGKPVSGRADPARRSQEIEAPYAPACSLAPPSRTHHPRPADGEPAASSFPIQLRPHARYKASNLLDYKAHRESKPTLLHFWMHVQNHRAVNQTTGLSCSQRDCKAPHFSPPVGGSSAPACPLRVAG